MYCLDCEYDLRGSVEGGVCPECGRGFDVGDSESYLSEAVFTARKDWRKGLLGAWGRMGLVWCLGWFLAFLAFEPSYIIPIGFVALFVGVGYLILGWNEISKLQKCWGVLSSDGGRWLVGVSCGLFVLSMLVVLLMTVIMFSFLMGVLSGS